VGDSALAVQNESDALSEADAPLFDLSKPTVYERFSGQRVNGAEA
jgi:hypothetical protein